METHRIELSHISISFPGVKALKDCDFQIESGEIRAVVGANGAGKSTLMKVLSGAYNHYEGEIFIDGQPVRIGSPLDAKEHGIEMVYQEVDTALFPSLSVAENIMFNSMVTGMKNRSLIDWSKMRRSAQKVIRELGLGISEDTLVSKLSLAQKQMVLIARAVQEECRFLILDEPTAPLSQNEVEQLFRLVRQLANEKKVGIIFISHRLPELFEICKSITVMRNGEMVIEKEEIGQNTSIKYIVNHMLGKTFEEVFPARETKKGQILFELKEICDCEGKVDKVDIRVREGEIVGISGLVGAGKTELSKLMFGANKCGSGKIFIRGEEAKISDTTKATASKIALIPEERRKEAIIVSQDLVSNLSIASIDKFLKFFSFVDKSAEYKNAEKYISLMGIKTPSPSQKVMYLSGGNQQKVAIGKWLSAEADIYIMDEPTKGIDVGAKREIFDLIYSLAARGKAIIYLSSEINEILAITDRVYVMYAGKVQKELVTAETTEQEILYYSTGGK
ncbi:MAG: sugar ABC transporter ATP-binding protein [Anaerolineaceae bacterium]|nr:sugar ABC transporter ATP-binding protein [Anaerolineaceae bacterium]